MIIFVLKATAVTSLVAQWIRLHAPNAGGLGSIPGLGTRSQIACCNCMLQLRVRMPQLRSSCATTKEPMCCN
ncbi:hypothetical protein DBR06_SOUSAS710187 [Sousa chinensis]|nr:hypothetical protein DBR06_SOUSAS710187 [Sousa chinensis]